MAAAAPARMMKTPLSLREHQVLFGLCGGLVAAQIGEVLGLSEKTVGALLNRIRAKLRVAGMSRVEMVVNLNAAIRYRFLNRPRPDSDPTPEGAG